MENITLSNNKKAFQTGNLFSSKYQSFSSIYDTNTNNTIIMLNFDRATVCEANDFFDFASKIIIKGNVRLIIDMESVYFIDSIFFGTLIKLFKHVSRMDGYIKLILDKKSKPELLSIDRFESIFEIYPNLFEAVYRTKAS